MVFDLTDKVAAILGERSRGVFLGWLLRHCQVGPVVRLFETADGETIADRLVQCMARNVPLSLK